MNIGRRWWLIAVALGTGAASYVAKLMSWNWIDGFAANLSAGFLGAFLTVILIDRRLETEREAEAKRVAALAFGRLRPILLLQFELLASWYKAASKEQRSPAPDAETFFTPDYFNTVEYLDFSGRAPQEGVNWFRFSARTFREFHTALQRTLDIYAPLIDTNSIETLEHLLASPIHSAIINLENLPQQDAARGIQRSYNMLAGYGVIESMRQYANLLDEFKRHFNKMAKHPISSTNCLAWRDDFAPAWGSGRIASDQLNRDAVMYMMVTFPPQSAH